jgi:hypothetical protein
MDDGEARYKRQKNQRLIYALFALSLFILVGLYDSPWAMVNRQTDLVVEPEYLSGLLSASGILFGLWAIFIGNKPKERVAKHGYENIIFPSFFTSLGFLILSVILVSLSGVKIFSPTYALLFCALSFILNALFLTLTLKYFNRLDT